MLARPEWIAAPAVPAPAASPGLLAQVRRWRRRRAERRQLARLDIRGLRDIGVTRADAQHEAAKPFWRD